MKRSISILVAVVGVASLGLSLTSCNNVACGPGTVQMQQTDGTLKCVATDYPAPLTPCDTDGGNAVIVGGKCVSAIQCDPNTTMNVNGICVGTGTGAGCSTPSAGKACVFGSILNFADNTKNTVEPIHVALYDPTELLAGKPAKAEADTTMGGSYVFQNFTPTQLGLIVIVTSSATAGPMMTTTATGDQGVNAGIYQVDAYAIKKADSDAWQFDIATAGAQIGEFFNDPKQPPNLLIANETHPVAGVNFQQNGSDAGVKYFNDTRTAIDPSLTTATGASGTGIVAAPVTGPFPTFSGSGPASMPITWEMLPGGSAPGLVFVTRFHPNM